MDLRVKEIAKAKGMQMQQLADILGFTRTNLTAIINGNPTIGTLENIATALNVKITDLFEPSNNDFMAVIDSKGELRRFDSIEDLKSYIQSIEPIK